MINMNFSSEIEWWRIEIIALRALLWALLRLAAAMATYGVSSMIGIGNGRMRGAGILAAGAGRCRGVSRHAIGAAAAHIFLYVTHLYHMGGSPSSGAAARRRAGRMIVMTWAIRIVGHMQTSLRNERCCA